LILSTKLNLQAEWARGKPVLGENSLRPRLESRFT
jgi:hypothetical protein